jgi:hypothetical protein
MRPNPPKMVTVVIAVLLTIAGLALIYFNDDAVRLVRQVSLPNDIERQLLGWMADRTIAYLCLAASPVLLILGSLLPGI